MNDWDVGISLEPVEGKFNNGKRIRKKKLQGQSSAEAETV